MLEYGEFNITFKVDEDFKNYLELHNWMRGLSDTENYTERAALNAVPEYTGDGTVSDISIIALNSAKNPNFQITFTDAFPIELGEVVFDSTMDDVSFITCDATFKYTVYEISKIY